MDSINLNKENGLKLWATDWNKLISTINLIIDKINTQEGSTSITKLSQLINDSGFITEEDVSEKANKSELARVATSGSYNDLIDKPSQEASAQGPEGKSAYQVAVDNGFVGTEQEWLASLKGEAGQNGLNGQDGASGLDGAPGQDGLDGKSAYELAVELGYEGTLELWLLSLHGQDGLNGQDGSPGQNGLNGITPHIDSFTKHWFIGETDTNIVAEGLDGQNGVNGTNGKSAYQSYLDTTTDNPVLTELQWANNDYNNLKNKPTIPEALILADWNLSDNTLKDYIKNKPIIPTAVSELQNDLGFWTISNGHDFVEIGGVKWATMNIGAENITDIGLYFQWGDTQGYTASQIGYGDKKYISWTDYKYSNGTNDPSAADMTKYNSTDGETILKDSDDAVQAAWGGRWRMPTTEEFAALGAATTSAWTTDYLGSGVSGLVLTDKTDLSKILFFPAAGFCGYGSINYAGSSGNFWSSSVYGSNLKNAYYVYFNNNNYVDWQETNLRYRGFSVRGVLDTTISKVAVTGSYNDLLDKPAQADWNQSDNTLVDYIKNKPSLATVATSGSYNDLTNKPIMPELIQSNWNLSDNTLKDYIKNKPTLFSKDYNDLLNKPSYFNANGHDYVEIGGLRWATMNLGANSITDYGLYYLWGDTQGYTFNDAVNKAYLEEGNDYIFGPYINLNYSKYNSTDGKTVLDLEDDAIAVAWGGTWRMPTAEELKEFEKAINVEWTSNYQESGIAGVICTDKTDSSKVLFFPMGGIVTPSTHLDTTHRDRLGGYWSSSYNRNFPGSSRVLKFLYDPSTDGDILDYWGYSGETRTYFCLIRGILADSYNFSTVAFSGDYNDLTNKPTIPTSGSSGTQVQADWNQTDSTQVDYIKNKPTITNGTNGKSAYLSYIDTTSDNPVLTEQQWIASLHGTNGTNGTNGTDGITPHIDLTTGNWFIGSTDTGVHALGPAGQGGSGSGVLSDWNETDNTSLAYIANKPTIPTVPANETAASGGSTLSVVTTGDKYNWNNKANVWQGTQAQYDALSPNYDSNTIYIITAS